MRAHAVSQFVLSRDLIIMDFFLMHTVDVKTVPVWYKRALQFKKVCGAKCSVIFSPIPARRKQGVGGGDTGTDTPDGVGACAPRA
jgi:hypothetical protein